MYIHKNGLGDNYPNPCPGAERTSRTDRTMLRLVFQRARWLTSDARRGSKKRLRAPAAHSVRFSNLPKKGGGKKEKERVPLRGSHASPSPSPTKDRGFDTKMKKKKKKKKKGRVGENKKRGEECGICPPDFPSLGRMCRSPTSESFQRLCANEKRRGGGGAGFFFRDHLVKAEPLLIFSSSGVPPSIAHVISTGCYSDASTCCRQ